MKYKNQKTIQQSRKLEIWLKIINLYANIIANIQVCAFPASR